MASSTATATRTGRARTLRPILVQTPDDRALSPEKAPGRRRARTTSRAGVRVRQAARVTASPKATPGPVPREQCESRRAHQQQADNDRPGAGEQRLPDTAERRSHGLRRVAPVPALREPPGQQQAEVRPAAEEDDDQEQLEKHRDIPACLDDPSEQPTGHGKAQADGDQGNQSQPDRSVHQQEDDQDQHDRRQRRPIERRADAVHERAAEDCVAGPLDGQALRRRRLRNAGPEPGEGFRDGRPHE